MMKKNYLLHSVFAGLSMAMTVLMASCGTDGEYDGEVPGYSADTYSSTKNAMIAGGDAGGSGSGHNGNTQAGVVTAGEWCDLDHWPFWSALMTGNVEEYASKSDYWKFYTNNRVAVSVTDAGGRPLAGISVILQRQNSDMPLWQAVTDNHGRANCWAGLFQKEDAKAETLRLVIDGVKQEQAPLLCQWDSVTQSVAENHYVVDKASAAKPNADIAFVVDATGSMTDEIDFLKSDLVDIISKAASVRPELTMRTAALFYRDEGDEYVTRVSDFTTNLQSTAKFVGEQRADGGGDYPEAVHTALEQMLQKLSWAESARTRIAFLILDAPAHYQDNVIYSLQHSVQLCAAMGIRLIPVAASGVDKNTEFMLRFFAVSTGGTYVFLTDDSGVGLSHIQATVGDYKVEQLNDLLIRLIGYYTE